MPIYLQSNVAQAIDQARNRLSRLLRKHSFELSEKLAEERILLTARKHRQLSLWDVAELDQVNPFQRHRRETARKTIEDTFTKWEKWIEDALTVEDAPWFRLAAVFIR